MSFTFLKPPVPAKYVYIDFAIYGPAEYPFNFIPVLHMDCLICKSRKPVPDFRRKDGWECPICGARTAKSMGSRILNFLREAT